MISVIQRKNWWFTLSFVMVFASIVGLLLWGLRPGIDFTGGSLVEINFENSRPDNQEISQAISQLQVGEVIVQLTDENGAILRLASITEEQHQQIIETIRAAFLGNTVSELRFDSIGPVIGQELKRKTVWAIGIVLVLMVLYIAWAFRKVSKPVAAWKYGLIAVVALFHNILITMGGFTVLGRLYGVEVNASFVAALLTILGYSVNDTIVIFDRIRENLLRRVGEDFGKIIDISINEVLTRSISTGCSTLLALFALLLLGGSTINNFVLALIIGISVGTYSSIFLASPMLLVFEKFTNRR